MCHMFGGEMTTKEKEEKRFLLVNLPDYEYESRLACPECYAPVPRNRADGRCDDCLKNKKILPVNYRRPPKKKEEEEEEDYS